MGAFQRSDFMNSQSAIMVVACLILVVIFNRDIMEDDADNWSVLLMPTLTSLLVISLSIGASGMLRKNKREKRA